MIELQPLFHVSGTGVVEPLGKVQGGDRVKIEHRGSTNPDSAISGKAHGTHWILVGPLGPGEASAVHEIVTPEKERVVVELRGYALSENGKGVGEGIEIRTAGIIRSSAARFHELNGRIALMIARLGKDNAIDVTAYKL